MNKPDENLEVKRRLFKITGRGILKSKNITIKNKFELNFLLGEDAILLINVSPRQKIKLNKIDSNEFSLEGKLENGFSIKINKVLLVSLGTISKGKFDPAKFRVISNVSLDSKTSSKNNDETILFKITNLEFTGTEKTFTPGGGWILDHFNLKIGKYFMKVKQIEQYKEIIKELRKQKGIGQTAEIIVQAKHKESDKVKKAVDDLCWLMSFAKGNTIAPFGEVYLKGNNIVKETYSNLHLEPFKGGDSVVPEIPFEELPNFLEKCYPQYKKHESKLGLNVIFSYHELMKRNPLLEGRCALGFILLESLSYFLQEEYTKKGKPLQSSLMNSKIKKLKKILPNDRAITNEIIDKLIEEFIYKSPTLEDSVAQLMKDFNMSYNLSEKKIFELRKYFIHKAGFPKEEKNYIQTYHLILNFINRLILHILGYSAEYIDVSDGYKTKKLT